MQQYFLGFDAGTQSVKVAIYDEHMNCVAEAANKTTLKYPHTGWVEMDAEEYLYLTKKGMKECALQLRNKKIPLNSVKSIMGDGIICGIVGIDESGEAITPYINYLDSRTEEDVKVINNLNLSLWQKETGNAEASCMFPAMHARWILANDENFKKSGKKFVHNAAYILSRLAGLNSEDAFIDWGTMSGWGLGYRVYDKEWSYEQLEILGIDKGYMPKIVKPWDIIGGLSIESARETGFPEGIPICAGAGDTMQSMLGNGVIDANRAVDVAGTCAMFCVSTSGIVPELSRRGSGLIFNSGTLENTYFYWGFVRTGGLSLRWFKDNLCKKSEDDNYYERLSREARKVSPGCNGVFFLPYLTDTHGEYSNLKGSFINMTLDTDQYVLWRAILESIAYEYLEITDVYRGAGIDINTITIAEGGSKDDLWNQIKADIIGTEVMTLQVSRGAVMTNCIVGSYAVGNIKDLKKSLIGTVKIHNEYMPNLYNTEFYRQQRKFQKYILKTMK
ncbi:FGGY family carbohydrate kinase [Clostridium pasteurianum]|uniref:FGGY-family carbohydrate kinase n=1 Tax=Clostridium pasteurianum TaxID=1501 RepID=UPI002260F093|nr:FGGY family carbohydrate kinase [Clostridium pasteurianum]UZW13367.1 FGGY family carbohydrate kinase [Clostridium pasteurianum]